MELCSLHPYDPATVTRYVAAMTGTSNAESVRAARSDYALALGGDERGANALSLGLAQELAREQPSFLQIGMGLTILEARIDRGVGMLLRPPSRLFGDAGLDLRAARAMPIRLDLSRGMMGGAHVPPRLVPELERLLESRTERFLRRLTAAEMDAVATMGLLLAACAHARERGLGLYEALDAIGPNGEGADGGLVVADRKRIEPGLRRRLEEAAKPPKKPGLAARLLGRR